MFRLPGKKIMTMEETYGRTLEKMLLPTRLQFNTRYAEQNDFLRRTIAVRNYPASFDTVCILQKLATTKWTTLTVYFEPVNQQGMADIFDKQINNKRAAANNSNKATEKLKAGVEETNIKAAYVDSLENNELFYHVTILVEAYAPNRDELNNKVNEIKQLLARFGITKDDLIYEQQPAFLSVFPCGENLMRHMSRSLPSSTAAALYMFSASDRSDPHGFYLGTTTDSGNIFLDFWLRNRGNPNGNFVIIGKPGEGKTTLMKKIVYMMIATGVSVYFLDPEGEYREEIAKLGGTVIDCASGEFMINPLEIRRIATKDDDADMNEDEKRSAPQAFREVMPMKQHLSWLRDFFKIMRPYATEPQINILLILVQDLYYRFHIDEGTELSQIKSDQYPTLGDLYDYIVEVYMNFDNFKDKYIMFRKEALQDIMLFMKDVYDGSESHLFNGHTNLTNSSIVDFDICTLLQGASSRTEAVMFNIMTWIWSKVTLRERRIFMGIDELSQIMNRENYTMAVYLRNFDKRSRKYHAVIGSATQNLEDFLDPAIAHVSSPLFNNPNYKFIFNPGEVDFHAVKKLLMLSDSEMDLIDKPNQGYCLLKAGGDKYHMHVEFMPQEADFFGKLSAG